MVPAAISVSKAMRGTQVNTPSFWESVIRELGPAEDQITARGLTSEIRVKGHDGAIHVPSMSFKADGCNVVPKTSASALGADTDAVLRGLGIDENRLEQLRAAGVI